MMNSEARKRKEGKDAESIEPLVVICDLDGTLALYGAHRGVLEYGKVLEDEANVPVVKVVHALLAAGYEVIYLSGRYDYCATDTLQWLRQHGLVSKRGSTDVELHMRKSNDFQPDEVIKRGMYERYVRDRGRTVLCAIDDRHVVVELWRSLGLVCLQVDDHE